MTGLCLCLWLLMYVKRMHCLRELTKHTSVTLSVSLCVTVCLRVCVRGVILLMATCNLPTPTVSGQLMNPTPKYDIDFHFNLFIHINKYVSKKQKVTSA